ncbi:MAG: vanadium-dependent haloperoxidase [Bacteroidetes bacterium]|nr:vanadium-dependent haloperoxidase [Bacteroidota bacterium]
MRKIFYLLLWTITSCSETGEITPTTPPEANVASNYEADFLQDWFKLECRLVKTTPGFLPPQAARAFGYTGITAYEAVYRGIPGARSLAGQITGLSPAQMPQADALSIQYHWGLVANAAVAEIMRMMFGKNLTDANRTLIDQKEQDYRTQLSQNAAGKAVADLSEKLGKDIALAIYEFSKTDGGHESYLNPFSRPYTPPTGVDQWVPTDATNQTPLSPHWKNCRPMLTSNMAFAVPPRPIPFSTDPQSDFYKAAEHVYQVVKNSSAEQQEIARFWADDPFATCTPTGHTFNILTQLLEETNATLEKSAVAYAMLGVAENDAFITCWKIKYDFNLIRPVSYIQKYIDPSFKTVIGTPPFPAYTSGHATEAAVGERIFIKLFTNGDGKYPFTDRSQVQHGFSVRKFTSFQQAAEECANSRLYGGIHYDMDNQRGLQMGRAIGDNVIKALNWPTNIK